MKKNLIVVDLDHTLIGVDSFQQYTTNKIRQASFPAIFLKTLRVLRVLDLENYKKLVVSWLIVKDHTISSFIKSLEEKLNIDLLQKLNLEFPPAKYKMIILSASPDVFVSPFGQMLNMDAYGSCFDEKENKWFHLHGEGKIEFLKKMFPLTEYNYTYAVSDSSTDSALLSLFERSDLIKPFKVNHAPSA